MGLLQPDHCFDDLFGIRSPVNIVTKKDQGVRLIGDLAQQGGQRGMTAMNITNNACFQ